MPQGCGALGAYQEGVYQALHEAGIEPDWVIGTSIDAINASLIAGNPPERRVARLQAFWSQVEQHGAAVLGQRRLRVWCHRARAAPSSMPCCGPQRGHRKIAPDQSPR